MVRGVWTRLGAAVSISVLSMVGITGGTAMAGDVNPCSTTTAPFLVVVDAPPLTELKPDGQMDIMVNVSNCTTADWSGNVRLELTSWVGDWCVPSGLFPVQAVSVRAGNTQKLSIRGTQPLCRGNYTATATAFDTVDRAAGSDTLGLYTKTNKPGP